LEELQILHNQYRAEHNVSSEIAAGKVVLLVDTLAHNHQHFLLQ